METSEKTVTEPEVKRTGTGQMLDVGGHRLYLRSSGEGSPSVIIESGAGSSSSIYGLLEEGIAKFTRVCVYDRAGLGRSESSGRPSDALEVTAQLHTLLQKATIPAPYIFVAHSLGGPYVRVFTQQYPDEVAGLVFLDVSHPEQFERLPKAGRMSSKVVVIIANIPLIGLRLFKLLFRGMEKTLKDLPLERLAELQAELNSSKHLKAVVGEYKVVDKVLAQTRNSGSLRDRPIAVFTAV